MYGIFLEYLHKVLFTFSEKRQQIYIFVFFLTKKLTLEVLELI